jgi:eukaryotic-like serine/threonine-protein kinase
MAITREQWQAISPLLAHAMELPDGARVAWLADLDTTQPALSPLLRSLLAADLRAERDRAFETASVLAGASVRVSSDLQPGQLVGSYRLSQALGRGGMGEVWLARQVEGGITRDVALKLPMLLGQASHWRERFRRERDILARLQHPNIATLFDAGVAGAEGAAGQPYLAMEYVEGVSLLDHATQHELPLRERILLFRQVLAAVGCAHRQLVIHRDIKPSNILVTPEGQAKLLDFGIAKLIEDESAGAATAAAADDLTRLGGRLLTYRYAAPEQVHGEALSTATDVYALGVVLHELLTGKSPYQRVRDGATPGLADFQRHDFAQPSSLTVTKGVNGDLDAIMLKALRREPADRYGTVEQFDDDLLRYLERRPVLARRGSRRYRMGRFMVRHRLPLIAAAVVAMSLMAGLVVAERERRIAVAAQVRAEKHFASVRDLAKTFIYDIEEDLRGLAGTLPVREKLARTAVKYLDSLASEAQTDPALMDELAGGYRRVGEVFSGSGNGNLGNIEAALANLLKAEALFDSPGKRGVPSRRILDDERRVHYSLATIFFSRNDPRWEQQSLRTMELARRLADTAGATAYDKVTAAGLLLEHLRMQQLATPGAVQSRPLLDEAQSRLAAAAPLVGTDVRAKGNLAIGYFTTGELLMLPGASREDLQRALEMDQAAVDLLRSLQKEVPDDVMYAAQADMVEISIAYALLQLDRNQEAEEAMVSAIARSGRTLLRDSQNVDIMLDHLSLLNMGVETAFHTGKMPLVIQRARESWTLAASVPAGAMERLSESAAGRAYTDYFGGLALLRSGPVQAPVACKHLWAVETYLRESKRKTPDAADLHKFAELGPALKRCPSVGRVGK